MNRIMIKKIIFFTILIVSLTGCIKVDNTSVSIDKGIIRPSFETGVIRIETKRGEFFDINTEIAKTLLEQEFGLMYVRKLDSNKGMWFPYNQERTLSFWMKNTLIPLDIIFINKDFQIVDIKENFLPCHEDVCESYMAKVKAQYVLEINSGYASRNNINIQDKVYPILIDN